MNQAKFENTFKDLPIATQKIFKAVPLSVMWSVGQIQGELTRIGCKKSHQDVNGTLGFLIEVGLVREPVKGKFVRAVTFTVPAEQVVEEKPKPIQSIQSAVVIDAKTTFNPMQIIAGFAARASQIEALAFNLKNDIEMAAVYIQEEFEKLENRPAPKVDAKAFLEGLLKQVS